MDMSTLEIWLSIGLLKVYMLKLFVVILNF